MKKCDDCIYRDEVEREGIWIPVCRKECEALEIKAGDAACADYDDGIATRKEMIQEAIKRMKFLKVYNPIINSFKHGTVSQCLPPLGGWYWLDKGIDDDVDAALAKIKEIEKEYNLVVYADLHTVVRFGSGDSWSEPCELHNFLVVCKYKSEWEYEWDELKQGIVFAYVYNKTWPDCSELGSIKVKRTIAGGLVRED